ncbi:MAG: RNA polymerase sigma factor [Myxococcota bacterium]|jgi:RNA polymerase sigma-70 factor (ECF subfamily)|nr:RNA polymerase sigma factor [Myxococcota bacterium]
MNETTQTQRPTRTAFADAALTCRERLWWVSLRLTRNPAEAEDLLQMTYVKAFERWEQLHDLERIQAWMLQTMRNVFVDLCRRNSHLPTESLSDQNTEAHPSTLGIRSDLQKDIEQAMSTLPPQAAEALLLRDGWGFSYDEIAVMMACPVGTVRSRIARAREQMIDIFRPRPAAAVRLRTS